MSEKSYFDVLVCGLRREDEDLFSTFCFEHGAAGVSEDLKFTQPELKYDPSVLETPVFDSHVFFEAPPSEDFLLKLPSQFVGARVEIREEAHRDWMQEWKKGFKPFLFVAPFWIVPSWFARPAEAEQVLWVDPGMAFGTGTHETTQLAAQLIVSDWSRVRGSQSVLDVGTGTGVLALMSYILKKGSPGRVLAIDNDPEARRVARENLAINKVEAIEVPDQNIQDLPMDHQEDAFDLVIANIIDGVLLDLKSELLRVRKPNAPLVLSGILLEREQAFIDQFLKGTDLKIQRRLVKNEWVGLLLQE